MTEEFKRVLDKMVEIRKTCPSGYVYILEEFGEVQQEWGKLQRGIGDEMKLREELVDVLCTIFVQFYIQNIDPDWVRELMMYKFHRAIKRHNESLKGDNHD